MARITIIQTHNSCYTYFKIVGDFNPDEVTRLLELQPEKTWKIGDCRKNGTKYDFALWEIVPIIYIGNQNTCLASAPDVIDFCYATRTEIDIDMYVYEADE